MKKTIIITVIIALIISLGVLCIPKHELPTDKEWEAYLEWEEEFYKWRDNLETVQPVLNDSLCYPVQ